MKLGGRAIKEALDAGIWHLYRDDEHLFFPNQYAELLQPNSLDVTLSKNFVRPNPKGGLLDVKDNSTVDYQSFQMDSITLLPGDFLLGCTNERIDCSRPLFLDGQYRYFAPMYEGRSTLGRLGIGTHVTAGFGDYGFKGAFTLEIFNINQVPVILYPGIRIGQLFFDEACSPYEYNGSYNDKQHYSYPVAPKLGKDKF